MTENSEELSLREMVLMYRRLLWKHVLYSKVKTRRVTPTAWQSEAVELKPMSLPATGITGSLWLDYTYGTSR